jgi:hypothetical protein
VQWAGCCRKILRTHRPEKPVELQLERRHAAAQRSKKLKELCRGANKFPLAAGRGALAVPLQAENFQPDPLPTRDFAPAVHRARSMSHVKDRIGVWSCIPESNLVQLPFG